MTKRGAFVMMRPGPQGLTAAPGPLRKGAVAYLAVGYFPCKGGGTYEKLGENPADSGMDAHSGPHVGHYSLLTVRKAPERPAF